MQSKSPKFHPALSTWWERTSKPERDERLVYYLALANPDLRRRMTALEEALDVWGAQENAKAKEYKDATYSSAIQHGYYERSKYSHGKKTRMCTVRIVSAAHLEANNVTDSFSNIHARLFLPRRAEGRDCAHT